MGAKMRYLYQCAAGVLFVLLAFGDKVGCIPLSDFYSFGSEAGDERNNITLDGSSGRIDLAFIFPLFGTNHTTVYINNNGIITFNAALPQYTSEPFPLNASDNRMIIAPYWADSDIRSGGTVWHRQTTDQNLLTRARCEVRSAFVDHMDFEPTNLLIATWDHIVYYQDIFFTRDLNNTNTFQCVMVTDQVRSFVIFNYADGEIKWTTGDDSGGLNGVGGTEAQVGFNAGDGIRFASVPGSQTPDIINIDTTSNVGIAGVWMFRVDEFEIVPPKECISGEGVALSIGPRSGSQLGGTAIYISGPCFSEDDTILCFFDNDRNLGLPGHTVNNRTAVCVSPRFDTLGWKTLMVGIRSNQTTEYSGRSRFYADHPEGLAHVTLDQETLLLNAESDEELTVRWNPQSILTAMDPSSYTVDITLYRFVIQPDDGVQLQSFVHVMRNQENNGIAIFSVPDSNSQDPLISERIHPVAIRVSIGRPAQPNSETTSLINFLGRSGESNSQGLVGQWTSTLYYSDAARFNRLCVAWPNTQVITGEQIRDRLPPCPPRVDQARTPNSGMTEDSGYWIEKTNRFFHPGAATCFRQSTFTRLHMGSGQQCCYRQNGRLLTGSPSGGTVDLTAPNGFERSVRHFYDDVIPAIFCCKGRESESSVTCEAIYYYNRPSGNESGYNPPPPACVYGDPHIVTLDGFKYTFNGLGEFVLIETPDNSFTLQGRMVQAIGSEGNPISATVFSAIVGRELYSDTIQFQLGDNDVDVLMNGEMVDFNNLSVQQFNNVTVTKGNRTASAVFASGVYIEVREANGILSTLLVSLSESYRSRTSGLMGNYNGDQSDDLLPRGFQDSYLPLNSTLEEIHSNFGLTWIIFNGQFSLFTYGNDESFNTFYRPFFQPEFEANFSSSALEEQADTICGSDPFCRFDIAATGRTDIGLTTLQGNIEFETIVNISQPVVCSPPCVFGVCVETNTCSCADGYSGQTCAQAIVRECETNPCENGGTCTLIATSSVCSCVDGFSGLFCQDNPVSGSGDLSPPECMCSRDIDCSLIGQLKNSIFSPTTNQLRCTIIAEPESSVREKFVVDNSFNVQYMSPGSLSFLVSIGVLSRSVGFSSCAFDVNPSRPLIDSLGAEYISIIYTKPDGSFGSIDFSMSSLQEIMSGSDDFTVGVELDEVNLCSLQTLLLQLSAPRPAQQGTCRDTSNDSSITIAYFPVNCM